MRKSLLVALAALIFAALPLSLAAAPARRITKPPVISGPYPFTGPVIDPTADRGQWFLDMRTGVLVEEVRPFEFYDNVIPEGGGFADSDAITGYAIAVAYGGAGVPGIDPIVGFKIRATITNDLPGSTLSPGAPGDNSHEERWVQGPRYSGTMYDVKLTAEFALPGGPVPVPIPFGNYPYFPPSPTGRIDALNYDELGWYCWSPAGPSLSLFPGSYMVPTYDFGDIPVGASVSRDLDFASFILPADPAYAALTNTAGQLRDLFLNRTTDLKIGDYVDNLGVDTGAPYPLTAHRSGDVSVFFNPVPEPSTYALGMAALGIGAFWYRRRRAV